MQQNLLAISDLDRKKIESILQAACGFCKNKTPKLFEGYVLASCFFEPSTRTRLSFESAMLKLGGSVLGFAESASTSSQKGETLEDTMRAIESFADIIVLRHPEAGSAKRAAEVIKTPLINAGDGANEHPSQTLIDLFTIQASQGKIDELKIGLAGDLKYARTIHSLVKALSLYSVKLYLASPHELALPENLKQELHQKKIPFSCHEHIEEIIPHLDILYLTRVQKERLQGEVFVKPCVLKKEMLAHAPKNLKILHPLPRVNEIEKTIDTTPYAHYFQQASYGVPVRMALLTYLLNQAL